MQRLQKRAPSGRKCSDPPPTGRQNHRSGKFGAVSPDFLLQGRRGRGRCDEERRSFKMTLSNRRRGLAKRPRRLNTLSSSLAPSKLRILAVAFISHRRFNKTLQSVDLPRWPPLCRHKAAGGGEPRPLRPRRLIPDVVRLSCEV